MSLTRNYTILEEIGQGSMATIHRAIQRSLERVVAIKRVHAHLSKTPEFVNRFEREAKASANLKHVNILDIIDFGRDDDGTHFIVMEYIDGPTLQNMMASADLPVNVVLSIILQVLAGLDHAHSNGVVHRDIKPANVMITSGGIVKITDFGIAQAAKLPSLTVAGMCIGTPNYMSPEQAAGKRLDHRSDLFSAGIVLYEMLARTLPFKGNTGAVLHQIMNEAPPPLPSVNPSVPEVLAEITAKALEKDVTQRFFDAAEFSHALEDAAFSLGLRTGPRIVKEYGEAQLGMKTAVKGLSTSQIRQLHPTHDSWGPRPTAAILPLTGCMGCHVNLLDLHEAVAEIPKALDLRFTHLMDVKEIPEVDIGIVEGCVANRHNEERLRTLRDKCTTLVALGSCACFGGIPGLRNLHSPQEVLDRAYADNGSRPNPTYVPALTERVQTVAQVVNVDASIPGCPSPPQMVLDALKGIIAGTDRKIPTRNLCHECGRRHEELLNPQRKLIADDVVPIMSLDRIDPDLCFLEQGVLCMGLATREGCGARCTSFNVPCAGCMGPTPNVQEGGVKWLDALASLLPGGRMRFKHDVTGSAYRYTLPSSMMPSRQGH